MHNTTLHPHIHLFVFSVNPKAWYLTVDGINKMKSAFSEVIITDVRQNIYTHKTEIRDEKRQKLMSYWQMFKQMPPISSEGVKEYGLYHWNL
jgi:hypothetical protein